MKLSLLKYFVWISLVLLAGNSCRSARVSYSGEVATRVRESILSGSFEKITLKTKVIFLDNEMSGLMLIKNSGKGNYKIAFYNELGMTYLEGNLKNTSRKYKLELKNIAPVINHKIFINNFEKSLCTLFSPAYNDHYLIEGTGFIPDKLIIRQRNGFTIELSPQENPK